MQDIKLSKPKKMLNVIELIASSEFYFKAIFNPEE